MESKNDLENKIKKLEEKLRQKMLERGEAIQNGGIHDNASVDSISTGIAVLEARIDRLKERKC
jgi:SMC interacting uncharacterized protein involved in chromosome segregation